MRIKKNLYLYIYIVFWSPFVKQNIHGDHFWTELVSSEGHIMPPHIFEVGLKVNTKGLGASPQVQRASSLASEGVLRLCTLLLLPPPPPTWTRWTTLVGHTSRTSPTWPLTTPKPAWSPLSAEYSPSSRRCLWKRHGPGSGSVSRRWLRLKAATLNGCQLYYIIKLPELIFSIKVLK